MNEAQSLSTSHIGMNKTAQVLASLSTRLVGSLIDGFVIMGIMVSIVLASGVAQQIRGDELNLSQPVCINVSGCLVYLAINGYLLCKRGQTIGKAALGTRIVDMSFRTPDLGTLFVLRHIAFGLLTRIPVLGWFIAMIDALLIFGPERRCLHDHPAGTRVKIA